METLSLPIGAMIGFCEQCGLNYEKKELGKSEHECAKGETTTPDRS